jgi:hypothetical protein
MGGYEKSTRLGAFYVAEAEALASCSQLTDIQYPTCALCTACNALWTARQRTLGQPRIRRIRWKQVSS